MVPTVGDVIRRWRTDPDNDCQRKINGGQQYAASCAPACLEARKGREGSIHQLLAERRIRMDQAHQFHFGSGRLHAF